MCHACNAVEITESQNKKEWMNETFWPCMKRGNMTEISDVLGLAHHVLLSKWSWR
jgi:hypothetical protein